MNITDKTVVFTTQSSDREILRDVYNSLVQKGYDPIQQLIGYITTEDPTYITNYNGARAKVRKIDRDNLLREMLEMYLLK